MQRNSQFWAALVSALAAGLLSACGSGGGGGYEPPPVNIMPRILGLQDQTLSQDTATPPLQFTVQDDDSGADRVAVRAQSSDISVIPEAGIVLAGSGAQRTIQITPADYATGMATITVSATDPQGNRSEQRVQVQVNAVPASFRSAVNEVMPMEETAAVRSLRGSTLSADADDDPTAFDSWLPPQ